MVVFSKIVRRIGHVWTDSLFSIGLLRAGDLLKAPGGRILVYHGLDRQGDKSLNGRFLPVSEFEAHARFLSDHARVVSLDAYFNGANAEGPMTVALTFDDGYRNNLHYALPVLEKYGLPAAFFVTGSGTAGAEWLWMDFLDVATRLGPETLWVDGIFFRKKRWRHTRFYADNRGRRLVHHARFGALSFIQKMENAFLEAGAWSEAAALQEYWALLSPAELRDLAGSPLATIGAHGHSHRDLAYMPHEAACAELRDQKSVLEKNCGRPVRALAYPFGAYTRALVDEAEKLGFTQQLAVDLLFAEDQQDARLRPRLVVNPYISPENQWLAVKKGQY